MCTVMNHVYCYEPCVLLCTMCTVMYNVYCYVQTVHCTSHKTKWNYYHPAHNDLMKRVPLGNSICYCEYNRRLYILVYMETGLTTSIYINIIHYTLPSAIIKCIFLRIRKLCFILASILPKINVL